MYLWILTFLGITLIRNSHKVSFSTFFFSTVVQCVFWAFLLYYSYIKLLLMCPFYRVRAVFSCRWGCWSWCSFFRCLKHRYWLKGAWCIILLGVADVTLRYLFGIILTKHSIALMVCSGISILILMFRFAYRCCCCCCCCCVGWVALIKKWWVQVTKTGVYVLSVVFLCVALSLIDSRYQFEHIIILILPSVLLNRFGSDNSICLNVFKVGFVLSTHVYFNLSNQRVLHCALLTLSHTLPVENALVIYLDMAQGSLFLTSTTIMLFVIAGKKSLSNIVYYACVAAFCFDTKLGVGASFFLFYGASKWLKIVLFALVPPLAVHYFENELPFLVYPVTLFLVIIGLRVVNAVKKYEFKNKYNEHFEFVIKWMWSFYLLLF